MSYILGSVVQQTGPSTTVTVCQAAKIKFYTDVVFPKIYIYDTNTTQNKICSSYSMRDLCGVLTNHEHPYLAVKYDNTVILIQLNSVHQECGDYLPRALADYVINAIVTRSKNILVELYSPFVVRVKRTLKPRELDFADNFDAYIAICSAETRENRLCGYACVAVASNSECRAKFPNYKLSYPQLVVDSEYSGPFCTSISPQSWFAFNDVEHQLNILMYDCEPSLSVAIQVEAYQYQAFKCAFMKYYQQQLVYFQTLTDAELFVQAQYMGLEMRPEQYSENVEGPVQFCLYKGCQEIEVSYDRLLSTVDQYVSLITNDNEADMILRDMKNQQFSGRVKIDGGDSTALLAQDQKDTESLYLYDINRYIAKQYIFHIAKGSRDLKTEIIDFYAGRQCQNLLNSSLTSQNGLVGISSNQLFVVDRRVSGKEATIDDSALNTKVRYTHLLVTKSGHAAVGNELGDVSLFSKIGNKALNKFPGSGFPVTSLCVDPEEKWLVVTTKFSIIVYSLYGSDGTYGFRNTIKVAERKAPIIARVSPSLISYLQCSDRGLRPAFLSRNRLISGSDKCLLVWNLNNLLERKNSLPVRLPLKSALISGGEYKDEVVVGLESGWSKVKGLQRDL